VRNKEVRTMDASRKLRTKTWLTTVAVALVALPLGAAAATGPPTIRFEPQAVVASGLTPGGQVVWFGVAREIADEVTTMVRRDAIAADDDRDGTVRLELTREVPWKSVWIAVDLATGEYAAAAPEGYPLRLVPWRGMGILQGQGGPDRIEEARSFVELLVVRPELGAWGYTAGDGGPRDEDGVPDNRLRMALERVVPIGASPAPPERLQPTDLVALVDASLLEVTIVRAGQPAGLGEGQ
jgi:hypothetical protein